MAYLLPQLLTHRAQHQRDQIAVIAGATHCTYGDLDHQSDQLAHLLSEAGVRRGDRVGLFVEKSVEAVVAIFGIMKAGAAYVPLDPTAPPKRVAFMIDNCQMKALISTQAKLLALYMAGPLATSLHCLLVTDSGTVSPVNGAHPPVIGWSAVLAAPATPPAPELIEDDLAYILYTSGSTGVPKGVMITHRASLTFIDWATDCFQLQPIDRVANHAPFHFDLSIFDLFATIKSGGTVILVAPTLALFPRTLAQFIEEQRITVWYSVPSALIRLVMDGELTRFAYAHLRLVLFAGEVFPIKHLRTLMTLLPHPAYYNLYGPTETNVCTWYQVPQLPADRVEPLSIGRACANSEIILLNEQQERVAQGEVGELCVRGPGLMKGYWGLPEKTQAVLHPYLVHPSLGPALIYHTGDLVRADVDGNLSYLGRRDHQIKSRGYRIELGEIAATLYSHPAVAEATVIAIPDESMGNRIAAIVVTQPDQPLMPGQLEAFCAERLPKYMIPGHIAFRSALPKTSTGKIDNVRLRQELLASQDDRVTE